MLHFYDTRFKDSHHIFSYTL